MVLPAPVATGLTEALAAAARDAKAGSALEEALVQALLSLDRYVIDARTRPLLVASLSSPSPATRQVAARGLLVGSRATAWPKETWGPVIALLDDASAEVRAGASFALRANRDRLSAADRKAVAARIEGHLADRSLGVRLGAVSALVGLRGRAFLADAKALERGEKNAKMRLVLKRAIAELA